MPSRDVHVRTQTFRIDVEQKNALVALRLIGFWKTADVAEFGKAQQTAVHDLGCAPGTHLVLADLSDFKLQSQEVVDAFTTLIATASIKARRLALVLGAGLAWMQAKRMVVRDKIAGFTDAKAARRWLLTGDVALEEPIDMLLARIAATKARELQRSSSENRP